MVDALDCAGSLGADARHDETRCESMGKEVLSQARKELDALVTACTEGLVPFESLDAEALALASTRLNELVAADIRYAKEKRYNNDDCADPALLEWRGKSVFVETAGLSREMVAAVSSCIRRLGARRCTERRAADAVVVRNPSAATSRTTLRAQLSGCRLRSPQYLQSGGTRGASRVYQKMLDRPRWICCSAGFARRMTF